MDWVLLVGRILFAAVFILSGLAFHLAKRAMAVEYARAKGAPLPELSAPLTGVAIVLAGVMIVIGLWVDLAALVIAAFLVATAYWMHAFWKVEDPMERLQEQTHFQKDLALAGGALILFYLFQQFGEEIGIAVEPALFD
ncbi:MAG TPA: DoxX family protein [Gaiellaceae bacterium]|nr:DoxX family protein [Gaiellaceae bacterium]